MKNKGAHNREMGIMERASGYTTKTKPGPDQGCEKTGTTIAHTWERWARHKNLAKIQQVQSSNNNGETWSLSPSLSNLAQTSYFLAYWISFSQKNCKLPVHCTCKNLAFTHTKYSNGICAIIIAFSTQIFIKRRAADGTCCMWNAHQQ